MVKHSSRLGGNSGLAIGTLDVAGVDILGGEGGVLNASMLDRLSHVCRPSSTSESQGDLIAACSPYVV